MHFMPFIHMARIRAFHRLRRVLAKQLVFPGMEGT